MDTQLIDKKLEAEIAERGRQIRKQALQRYYAFVFALVGAMILSSYLPGAASLFVIAFLFCAVAAALPAMRADKAFSKQQYNLANMYADQAMTLNLQLYPISTWTIGHMIDLQMRQHVQQGNHPQVEAMGKLIWSLTERKEVDYKAPPKSAWAANYVALAYLGEERYEEAIELFSAILKKCNRHDHRGVLINNLGYAYFRSQQFVAAESTLRQGLNMYRKPRSQMQKRISAHIKSNLGRTLLQMDRIEDAEVMLEECLVERERDKAAPNELAEIHRGIAELRIKQGRPEEAELFFNNALGLYRQFYAAHHPVIAETLEAQADLLDSFGRSAEAQKLRQEAEFVRYEREENSRQSLTKVIAAFSSNEHLITMLTK